MQGEREALAPCAGIGLKLRHVEEFLRQKPPIGFVEVHAENYMLDGGIRLAQLDAVRQDYPLSIHGVAASLGAESGLDLEHLRRLKLLVERYQPAVFSEHLAWSSHSGVYYNDLLPLAYTRSSLDRVVAHIDQLQNCLGRKVLIENPSTYLAFKSSQFSEAQFMAELVSRCGCGLLLDLTNLLVSTTNQGLDIEEYLRTLPLGEVGEIHLAGFAQESSKEGGHLLIDSHDRPVSPKVWALFEDVVGQIGAKPTLLERDGALPELSDLLAEAQQAEAYLNELEVFGAG